MRQRGALRQAGRAARIPQQQQVRAAERNRFERERFAGGNARASGIEPGGSASHVPAGASTTPRSPRPTLSTVRTRVPPTTSANVPIDPPHTSATSTPASLS